MGHIALGVMPVWPHPVTQRGNHRQAVSTLQIIYAEIETLKIKLSQPAACTS
jgi:hypothetical protein